MRTMHSKENSSVSSERKEESWRESFQLLREYINNHEHNVGRNKDIKEIRTFW